MELARTRTCSLRPAQAVRRPGVRCNHAPSKCAEYSAADAECNLAIAAAGGTLYELCACDVPTVTYAFVDNQIFGMNMFAKKDLMLGAGDIRNMETPVCKLVDYARQLSDNWRKKVDFAPNMKNITAGTDASYLVNVVMSENRSAIIKES